MNDDLAAAVDAPVRDRFLHLGQAQVQDETSALEENFVTDQNQIVARVAEGDLALLHQLGGHLAVEIVDFHRLIARAPRPDVFAHRDAPRDHPREPRLSDAAPRVDEARVALAKPVAQESTRAAVSSSLRKALPLQFAIFVSASSIDPIERDLSLRCCSGIFSSSLCFRQ